MSEVSDIDKLIEKAEDIVKTAKENVELSRIEGSKEKIEENLETLNEICQESLDIIMKDEKNTVKCDHKWYDIRGNLQYQEVDKTLKPLILKFCKKCKKVRAELRW